ncbi:MAG TPA: sigma-70 family RNA polymerase sigma factor [Candidatus Acidoferrales bacterium]|nr:sigma-70 family RNA polymerase sigma factor [Candidatus Acidoferrales bacterium]
MMEQLKRVTQRPKLFWENRQIVRGCLNGDEFAWDAFLDKYKNLIYSIPIKYGFSADDASDIFQAVCMDVLTELPRLREPDALPKWLIQMTSHRCFHWKREQQRYVSSDAEERPELPDDLSPLKDELLVEAEQDQILREAVASLPGRCQQLVQMLFFDLTIRPYAEVARSLGLATGSIGFIRQRCLEKLRRKLVEMGFQ